LAIEQLKPPADSPRKGAFGRLSLWRQAMGKVGVSLRWIKHREKNMHKNAAIETRCMQ